MNKDKQIDKLQETLDTANQTIADVSKKLEELKADKGLDFREWHKENEHNIISISDIMINVCGGGILGNKTHYHEVMRIQAEQIIKQHWKRIIGDYVPDWESTNFDKLDIWYKSNDVIFSASCMSQQFPDWFYAPLSMESEIKAEIERMKNLYGVDVVKYYLTGRF
jgi:hypothetical protein